MKVWLSLLLCCGCLACTQAEPETPPLGILVGTIVNANAYHSTCKMYQMDVPYPATCFVAICDTDVSMAMTCFPAKE